MLASPVEWACFIYIISGGGVVPAHVGQMARPLGPLHHPLHLTVHLAVPAVGAVMVGLVHMGLGSTLLGTS